MTSDAHSVNPTHDTISGGAVPGHGCCVCPPHGAA